MILVQLVVLHSMVDGTWPCWHSDYVALSGLTCGSTSGDNEGSGSSQWGGCSYAVTWPFKRGTVWEGECRAMAVGQGTYSTIQLLVLLLFIKLASTTVVFGSTLQGLRTSLSPYLLPSSFQTNYGHGTLLSL